MEDKKKEVPPPPPEKKEDKGKGAGKTSAKVSSKSEQSSSRSEQSSSKSQQSSRKTADKALSTDKALAVNKAVPEAGAQNPILVQILAEMRSLSKKQGEMAEQMDSQVRIF